MRPLCPPARRQFARLKRRALLMPMPRHMPRRLLRVCRLPVKDNAAALINAPGYTLQSGRYADIVVYVVLVISCFGTYDPRGSSIKPRQQRTRKGVCQQRYARLFSDRSIRTC